MRVTDHRSDSDAEGREKVGDDEVTSRNLTARGRPMSTLHRRALLGETHSSRTRVARCSRDSRDLIPQNVAIVESEVLVLAAGTRRRAREGNKSVNLVCDVEIRTCVKIEAI